MSYPGSGFITIIIYATQGGNVGDDDNILTESSIDVLTESSLNLQVE